MVVGTIGMIMVGLGLIRYFTLMYDVQGFGLSLIGFSLVNNYIFILEKKAGASNVNETVQQKDISFTLQSIDFTDVSTVISYEQVITDELLKEWPSVTPVFYVTDDLGHVYRDGTGGGGRSPDNGKTFKATTAFGTFLEGASQLIIQPVEITSLMYRKGYTIFSYFCV